MVNIYIFDQSIIKNIKSMYDELPLSVQKYIDKYKQIERKYSSILAYHKLCEVLSLDKNVELEFNQYGKPSIKGVYFNISHSLNISILAIGDSPLGVDVEYINPVRDYEKLIEKVLSKEEIKEYHSSSDKNSFFVKKWTEKEAYFKYLGTGINVNYLNINIDKEIFSKKVKDSFLNEYYLSLVSDSLNEINIIE